MYAYKLVPIKIKIVYKHNFAHQTFNMHKLECRAVTGKLTRAEIRGTAKYKLVSQV